MIFICMLKYDQCTSSFNVIRTCISKGIQGIPGPIGLPGDKGKTKIIRTDWNSHFAKIPKMFLFIFDKGLTGERGKDGERGPIG